MALLIGFLTFVLVMNCLFLMLLVLIQLPKKEAGAGIAFGGGATDALFGAGSGNALTKLTKYAAGTFLVLALGLAFLNVRNSRSSTRNLEQLLSSGPSRSTPAATLPATTPAPLTSATNLLPRNASTNMLLTMPATNASAPAANTATPANKPATPATAPASNPKK